MLRLRLQGWPLQDLAELYGCDKTSVHKACIRNGLPRRLELLPRPVIIFRHVYADYNGERLNRGKNYSDYMKTAKARQLSITVRRIG